MNNIDAVFMTDEDDEIRGAEFDKLLNVSITIEP